MNSFILKQLKSRKSLSILLISCIIVVIIVVISLIRYHISQNALPKEISIELSEGITMEFVLIKDGSFMMGSYEEEGDEDETPRHKVTITKPFYMGKYEVNQEQWIEIMGENPSEFKNSQNPVDTVSWQDCILFTKELSKLTQNNINLPTEAQWEYACRAETTTKWFFGADEEEAGEYGWIDLNSEGMTHPVGLKMPNNWGLYDMYGNVQEWCLDWYENPYSQTDEKNPEGPKKGESRVIRGGGWGDFPDNARSSYRNAIGEEIANNGCGFRCVLYLYN